MSDSLWPHGLYSPWNSPGQNTGVGSLSLLQGIFPTQGSNPGLPHCRWLLYQLSHKGSPVKNPLANARDIRDEGLIPGSGRCPGGGHGSPLQYSCLEKPMDRGAWRATVHRVTKSQTRLKRQHTHIVLCFSQCSTTAKIWITFSCDTSVQNPLISPVTKVVLASGCSGGGVEDLNSFKGSRNPNSSGRLVWKPAHIPQEGKKCSQPHLLPCSHHPSPLPLGIWNCYSNWLDSRMLLMDYCLMVGRSLRG